MRNIRRYERMLIDKTDVVSRDDDRAKVETFALELEQPLASNDVVDGWTGEARLASLEAARRVLADLDRGWGEEANHASRHLVRVLDRWGIGARSEARLARSAAAAQSALIRMRPPTP
jgi:hypothetical protein